MRQLFFRSDRQTIPYHRELSEGADVARRRRPMCFADLKNRWSSSGLWLTLGMLGLLASSTARASDPADLVPESASVVLRCQAPQATLSKFADYVDGVQPGFGASVNGALPLLGNAIFVPNLVGVDVENDWWVIVFATSEEETSVVFVIPTSDAKAVEAALPDDFEFHLDGTLAIYSKDKDALEKVRDRISDKGKVIWPKINASSKKLFDSSDISAVVNIEQLAKDFNDELAEAEPQMNQFFDDLPNLLPTARSAPMTAALEMYRSLGKALIQGVKDSKSLAAGVVISKELIRFEHRIHVEDKTQTAQFFGSHPASDLSMINGLPTNKSMYFAAHVDIAGMVDWSMSMTKDMLTDLSDQQKAEFDAAAKQMKTLQYGDLAGYLDIDPTSPGAFRAGSVVDVTPTDRMRDLSRSLVKTMATLKGPGFTQTTTLEPAALKIAGVDADRLTIQQTFDQSADPSGIQEKIRVLLFGEEGMKQLVLYQPKRVLQTFGGGTAEMLALVNSLGSTATGNVTAVSTARKRLPDKANVIVLIDVVRMIANGARLAIKEGALPLDPKQLDDLDLSPSFIAYSVAFEPTAARTQFDIPVAQADGIAKLVSLIMNARK